MGWSRVVGLGGMGGWVIYIFNNFPDVWDLAVLVEVVGNVC